MLPILRQLSYKPLDSVLHDLDRAMHWLCIEAAQDIDYNLDEMLSAKLWLHVRVHYESANPEDPKAKEFDNTLSVRPTIIGKHPITGPEPYRPYQEALRTLADRVLEFHARFIRKESGFVLSHIYECHLYILKFNPIGDAYVPLPKFLESKKAIINVHNSDNRCFGYAVLSALKDQLAGHNKSKTSYYSEIDFHEHGLDQIEYPVPVEMIPELEEKLQISFNVFSFFDNEGQARYVMRVSKRSMPRHIDLLYYNEHYAWIKNFSRLFHDITDKKRKYFFCKRCLSHFTKEETLKRHEQLCTREEYCSIQHILPSPGSSIEFRAYKFQTRAPFVIYADLESVLEPIDEHSGNTLYYQHHRCCAAAAILCSPYAGFNNLCFMHTGEDAIDRFLEKINEWEGMCIEYLRAHCKMRPLSTEQETKYNNAKECCICHNKKRPFKSDDDDWRKVRDHDHVTGYYIGPAHNLCNKRRRIVFQVPVFIHNFRGYDGHLIVHSFHKFPQREIKVIGQSMERYLQVAWGKNIVFRDSLQHLSSSLEKLVESLLKVGEQKFQHLSYMANARYCRDGESMDLNLITRKGVFPYEYLSDMKVLDENSLPPREAFTSRLCSSEITNADYEHAQKVWKKFQCKTMRDYLELYLLTDVCLLADVFETFRETSKEAYDLDPAYFVSAPQLAWNAMLRFIKRPIHLITDAEMYRMIQPAVRGGICHASVRYARANNKYMGSRYRPEEESSFILYIDATNLYGLAMSQPLPDNDFTWLSEEECRAAEMALAGSEESRDAFFEVDPQTFKWYYILEVDLEYPAELHDRDDDYPMAPELLDITPEMLSETQHRLVVKYFNAAVPGNKKLICSLLNKRNYVVFGQMLQLYLIRGMKLTKVHRGIKFTAQPYLAAYIQHNTERRFANRTDETKKNFYKLMNNSPYGKTIENMAKRSDIRLLINPDKVRKLAEQPHCIDFRVFSENLFGIEMRKTKSLINKPFQVRRLDITFCFQ